MGEVKLQHITPIDATHRAQSTCIKQNMRDTNLTRIWIVVTAIGIGLPTEKIRDRL